MTTEFHLFSALPTELRQEIWNLAISIRPKPAGVRVFRVFDASQEPSIRLQDIPDYKPHKVHTLALGTPLPDKDFVSITGESISDISTQVHDPELWNTCQESRLMMKKAFVSLEGYNFDSMGYCLSGSAPFYVTLTDQGHNLFILRPDSVDFDLEDVFGAFSKTELAFGIEYRPEWGSQLYAEEQGGEMCLAARQIADLGSDLDVGYVYLVDYNLKLKTDASCKRKPHDLRTRYYARDRKLVEMHLGHENERDNWEYINPIPDGDYRKSSFYFAESMMEAFDEAEWKITDGHGGIRTPGFGLLGWDEF
ncbi:uncharacterized protein FSUBG_13419 [Fusarium subglutinans]|uniref:2EXR domain-containing protein n=1 Tax=Gibberella subglutinans TaxID=42677 RepID=A0A8H5KXI5_GIBSU|nr:uncharacterized protein FSUBG_13419 [Fusarium subglutinans]KAF5580306.1 hypothetical protein FSUBG_13419 [Fusarium subglutinans]